MMQAKEDFDDDAPVVTLGEVIDRANEERKWHEEALSDVVDQVVGRNQPLYVIESERIVLGACLVDPVETLPQLEDVGLRGSDFYRRQHGIVFDAITALNERGSFVDLMSVVDELNKRKQLGDVGGMPAVLQLEDTQPTAYQGASAARIVIEKSKLRTVASVAASALERVKFGHSAADLIDSIEEGLTLAQQARGVGEFADLLSTTNAALAALPVLGGEIRGYTTGFLDVDRLFRLRDGGLYIVAGRPAMGKTQFVLDVVREVCVKRGQSTAFFSLEMSAEELTTRMLASKAALDVKRSTMPPHEIAELQNAAGMVSEAPLFIDDSPGITVGELRARCRAAHRRNPLRLIVVDYLQLIEFEHETGNTSTDFGRVSRKLKQLARELLCPVIALSQLNRAVESRSDKRPVMSDLRESGAIEQDADAIAMLYREEYYLKEKTEEYDRGVAEVLVQKNRHGPTGVARLRFEKQVPRFDNLAREDW